MKTSIEYIIIKCLQGEDLRVVSAHIDVLCDAKKIKKPRKIFENADNVDSEEIFKLLERETQESFKQWCHAAQKKPNFMLLLNYLVKEKKINRLRPMIAKINSADNFIWLILDYLFKATVALSVTALFYFLCNLSRLNDIIALINCNSARIKEALYQYILIAQNLALLAIVFEIIIVVWQLYHIVAHETLSKESKRQKIAILICRTTLTMAARVLTFLNSGILPATAGTLYIVSAFLELVYSYYTYSMCEKPILPGEDNEDKLTLVHYYETFYYLRRKEMIFYHQIVALSLIAIITTASLLTAPHFAILSILCVIVQLLIILLKNYSIVVSQGQLDKELATRINEVFYPEGEIKNNPSNKKLDSDINDNKPSRARAASFPY